MERETISMRGGPVRERWFSRVLVLSLLLAQSACRDASPYDPARCEASSAGCDLDGDGHLSLTTGGDDCDDTSSDVYPGANDAPGDGIDQDCAGGDALPPGDDDLSPGDDDLSPGDDDLSPGDDDLSPGDDDLSPGDDDLSPGDDDLSPGDDDLSPGDDDLSRGDDDLSPGDDDLSPGGGVDLDGDGFTSLETGGTDCADDDPSTYPGAFDTPGDGIDTNCSTVQDYIYLFAGDGEHSDGGDGGSALEASFVGPTSITVDAEGRIYVADSSAHVVRRIDVNGVIERYAGNGEQTSSGDGGPATAASLVSPTGLAVDAAGNLYIADPYGLRVRRVDTNGTITTFAGNGTSTQVDEVKATKTGFKTPYGVAVDADGSVYVADHDANRVRWIDPGQVIHAFAGTGDGGYSGDGGPALDAQLNGPDDLAVATDGGVYINDNGNLRVRLVDLAGEIRTVLGNGLSGDSGNDGPADEASISSAHGISVDLAGSLYLADTSNNWVRRVDPYGMVTRIVGPEEMHYQDYSGDGGPAVEARLNLPRDMCVDPFGRVFISDTDNSRVRIVLP